MPQNILEPKHFFARSLLGLENAHGFEWPQQSSYGICSTKLFLSSYGILFTKICPTVPDCTPWEPAIVPNFPNLARDTCSHVMARFHPISDLCLPGSRRFQIKSFQIWWKMKTEDRNQYWPTNQYIYFEPVWKHVSQLLLLRQLTQNTAMNSQNILGVNLRSSIPRRCLCGPFFVLLRFWFSLGCLLRLGIEALEQTVGCSLGRQEQREGRIGCGTCSLFLHSIKM